MQRTAPKEEEEAGESGWGSWADALARKGVEWIQTAAFTDRERAGYRLPARNDDGLHLVEQQAYLSDRDGQIGWLRILCDGYRTAE